jgi:hypothetical protein
MIYRAAMYVESSILPIDYTSIYTYTIYIIINTPHKKRQTRGTMKLTYRNEYIARANFEQEQLAQKMASESGLPFEIEEREEEHCRIILHDARLPSGITIGVNYSDYSKTFSFYLDYRLPYFSHNEQVGIFTDEAPQKMHKLNGKRINQWIDYLIIVSKRVADISRDRVETVTNFIAEARNAGMTINERLNWDKQPTGAYYIHGSKNGIEYNCEISGDTGYISQKLGISYEVRPSINAFLTLSGSK